MSIKLKWLPKQFAGDYSYPDDENQDEEEKTEKGFSKGAFIF